MSDRTPLGPVIDALGIEAELEDDDQIVSAVVLAKVHNFETGNTTLGFFSPETMDWIERYGIICASHDIIREGGFDTPEDA